MLQQHFNNKKFTKSQIETINNMHVKYTNVKNEIDIKITDLINLFLNDLSSFFENIEEVSKERKKTKDYDSLKKEYDILSLKLKEKSLNEQKLKNSIELLQNEIASLKLENKIKAKNTNKEHYSLTASRNPPFKSFIKKHHIKGKSEVINPNLDNTMSKYNTLNNTLNNTRTNIFESSNKKKVKKIIPYTSVKQRFRENYSIEKHRTNKTLTLTEAKDVLNISNQNDKIIERIRKYDENRMNAQIKKMQELKTIKKKKIKKKLLTSAGLFNKQKKFLLDIIKEKQVKNDKQETKKTKDNSEKEELQHKTLAVKMEDKLKKVENEQKEDKKLENDEERRRQLKELIEKDLIDDTKLINEKDLINVNDPLNENEINQDKDILNARDIVNELINENN